MEVLVPLLNSTKASLPIDPYHLANLYLASLTIYSRLTLPISTPQALLTALHRLLHLYPSHGGLRGYLHQNTTTALLPLLDTLLTPYRTACPSGALFLLPDTAVSILLTLSSYLTTAQSQLDLPLTSFFLRHLNLVAITHMEDFTGSHLITHILRVVVSRTQEYKGKLKLEG